MSRKREAKRSSFWILKPPGSSCGIGIKIVNKFEDVPISEEQPYCVQRYNKRPLLINGLKFDIRIYILITSVDPLRIYLFKEGPARYDQICILNSNFSGSPQKNIQMIQMKLTTISST